VTFNSRQWSIHNKHSIYFHVRQCLVSLGPLESLLGLGDEVRHHVGDELLLVVVDGAVAVDDVNAVLAKSHRGGEEGSVGDGGLDEGALGDALLAREGSHDAVSELSSGVGHGESGRASASLGLDDLVTTEHDALSEGIALGIGESGLGLNLGEEGNDGGARVSSDDRDACLRCETSPYKHTRQNIRQHDNHDDEHEIEVRERQIEF
jgi:hypothetical protein